MDTNEDKTGNNKKPSTPFFVATTAVITALLTSLISYNAAKYQVEKQAAIILDSSTEKFEARLEEYPKLWKIILPISSRAPNQLTPRGCAQIAQELNQWLYGRGGLVSHEYTRSLVWQLRNACGDWKSGKRPKKIYDLKNAIIYSTRNDLYLVARKDVDIPTLYQLIKKRDKEIKRLRRKARLFRE